MEVFKTIEGYENYQISNMGRVKSIERKEFCKANNSYSLRKEKLLKPYKSPKGYLNVYLCKNGSKKGFRINRLVAISFIPNPENKPEVGHMFGDKLDNRDIVLEWQTRTENQRHAFDTGLCVAPKGNNHYNCKITDSQVLEIRASNLTNKKISVIYNVDPSTISYIKSNITRKL